MNILKANIFRASIFKQIKFLASSPLSSQDVYYISEAGTISKEIMPIHTGFMNPAIIKKAWIVIHSLKFKPYKDGIPLQTDAVLAISDRSYIPLDPNGVIKEEDKERLASLKDIAKMNHAGARADVRPNRDGSTDTATLIINSSFVMLGMLVIVFFFLKSCGGGQ